MILLKFDDDSKVGVYGAVLPFGLIVCLRVKGGQEALFDVKEVTKQWPEFCSKKRASVGHN